MTRTLLENAALVDLRLLSLLFELYSTIGLANNIHTLTHYNICCFEQVHLQQQWCHSSAHLRHS